MENLQRYTRADARQAISKHPELFEAVQIGMSDKTFLKLGDSWHQDKKLQNFLSSPDLAALFNHAAIGQVAIEFARQGADSHITTRLGEKSRRHAIGNLGREFWLRERRGFWNTVLETRKAWNARHNIRGLEQAIKELSNGKSELRRHLDRQFTGFGAAGLKVHACDNFQWMRPLVPGNAERLFLGDREIADKIKSITPENNKSAIIYGAAHFRYIGTMGDKLPPEDSLHIDLYSSRRAYEKIRRHFTTRADLMPDYVYLLKERSLESPDPELYGIAPEPSDDADACIDTVLRRYADKVSRPYEDVFQRQKMQVVLDYSFSPPMDDEREIKGITRLPTTDKKYFTLMPSNTLL